MRSDGRPDTAEMTLALLAWRYAAGELAPDQAAAFETRLGTDPAAQNALAEAVRLSARAVGQAPPAPDPLARSAILGRLRPAASVLGQVVAAVVRRRPYRGHPVTWAGVGAGVAAGVLACGVYLADADRGPPPAPPTVQAPRDAPAPLPDLSRTAATPDPAPPAVVPDRVGGGGEPLPPNPATTFLPPNLGPADPLPGTPGGAVESMVP